MTGGLESILHGISIEKYEDWLVFVQRLEELVRRGRARRISPLRTEFFEGEEWYLDSESGEVFVYLSPDPPILPIWKRVDVFSRPETVQSGRTGMAVTPTGMAAIPIGNMSNRETASLKLFLQILVCNGMARMCDQPCPIDPRPKGNMESWYQDLRTNVVYRLVENFDENFGRWELAPPIQEATAIQ